MSDETTVLPPIEVPPEALNEELLHALIESFVLREGTDYGSYEISLEKKIEDVRKQMKRGVLKIAFDPKTESVTILTADQWKRNVAAYVKSSSEDVSSGRPVPDAEI